MNTERIEKLDKYRQLNEIAIKGQIVFVGSSLAEQFPVNEMLNNIPLRYIVYNRGIGGDTSDDLLNSLDSCIFDLEPSKLFINIGSNDMNDGYSQKGLLKNYTRILTEIRDKFPAIRIYVLSYYPVNEKKMLDGFHRSNIKICRTNEKLAKLAAAFGYEYVDVHTILLDDDHMLNEKYTTDGIHLLPNAYWKILRILINYF